MANSLEAELKLHNLPRAWKALIATEVDLDALMSRLDDRLMNFMLRKAPGTTGKEISNLIRKVIEMTIPAPRTLQDLLKLSTAFKNAMRWCVSCMLLKEVKHLTQSRYNVLRLNLPGSIGPAFLAELMVHQAAMDLALPCDAENPQESLYDVLVEIALLN